MAGQRRKRLWTGTAIAVPLVILACFLSGLSLHPGSLGRLIFYLLAIAIALRVDPFAFPKLAKLIAAADAFLLFGFTSIAGAVASYVAIRHAGAMTDGVLARADHVLGLDWLSIRRMVDDHPRLLGLSIVAYRACAWLPALIAVALAVSGRIDHLYRFLSAYSIALILTVAVCVFFPARAAFVHYGYLPLPPNAVHYGAIIAGLRDGSMAVVNLNSLGGIVTFPSFHAVMAILFAWALWPIRWLRLPTLAINGAMWASAVPIGGHYFVDLLGGSLIAYAGIRLSDATRASRTLAYIRSIRSRTIIAPQPAE